MARPREFDMETAIAGAMEIFWRQGFKATSLPDLLDAMGLSRGSFYKAFDDKESVYLKALDHYDQVVVSGTVARLGVCDGDCAADCLEMLFAPTGAIERGCFICNAMVELAPDNEEVAQRTRAMAHRLQSAIGDVLARHGYGPGQVHELADVILHLYFGHQAIGKAGHPAENWQQRLHHVLALPLR